MQSGICFNPSVGILSVQTIYIRAICPYECIRFNPSVGILSVQTGHDATVHHGTAPVSIPRSGF